MELEIVVDDGIFAKIVKTLQEKAARPGRGVMMVCRISNEAKFDGYGFALLVTIGKTTAALHGRTKRKGEASSMYFFPSFSADIHMREALVWNYFQLTARMMRETEKALFARIENAEPGRLTNSELWQPLWRTLSGEVADLPLGNMPPDMQEHIRSCVRTHVAENLTQAA
jgi:hypothetical protein